MGEGKPPRRSKPTDLSVEVIQFSVPTWESVIVHESETRAYRGHPPPDMAAECHEAGKEARLIAATHHARSTGLTHPYAIGSPAGMDYIYACEPEVEEPLLSHLPKIEFQYVFNSAAPPDLSVLYAQQDGEEDTRFPYLLRTTGDNMYFVAPIRNGKTQIVQVTDDGEDVMAATVRAAVLYYMYGALEHPHWIASLAEAMPYLTDTEAIVNARMQHVTKWRFKTSRTRPLYA